MSSEHYTIFSALLKQNVLNSLQTVWAELLLQYRQVWACLVPGQQWDSKTAQQGSSRCLTGRWADSSLSAILEKSTFSGQPKTKDKSINKIQAYLQTK